MIGPRGCATAVPDPRPGVVLADVVGPVKAFRCRRSARGDQSPLLIGAGTAGVLAEVGAVGGAAHAVEVQACRTVLEARVAGRGHLGPLLVAAGGAAVLTRCGAVGNAPHAVEVQPGGAVLDTHITSVAHNCPLLIG